MCSLNDLSTGVVSHTVFKDGGQIIKPANLCKNTHFNTWMKGLNIWTKGKFNKTKQKGNLRASLEKQDEHLIYFC